MTIKRLAFGIGLISTAALGNPYPDPGAVPQDAPGLYRVGGRLTTLDAEALRAAAFDAVRVEVGWEEDKGTETYRLTSVTRERSGTEALMRRAAFEDPHGSFKATLTDERTGQVWHDAIGTGTHYRRLTRALTFRFPAPQGNARLKVRAEDPQTGRLVTVVDELIAAVHIEPQQVEVKLVQAAAESPSLALNIYAEGYSEDRKAQFWKDAEKVAQALTKNDFPGYRQLQIRAVFAPSVEKLGKAKELGLPVAERNSFLGLYFPYWHPFGRWYHVVYPTRESRYRSALGSVPYDYPFALLDDSQYWGVGNFRELTAIPAGSSSFTYLLLHEFGHFFGLNEEYESGGATELAFAPGIDEPWSQNITFLSDPGALKWKAHVHASTPVPTPESHWKGSGPYGAYRGGYAETEPLGKSHKPGFNCTMSSGRKFCPVCHAAILERVRFDTGG